MKRLLRIVFLLGFARGTYWLFDHQGAIDLWNKIISYPQQRFTKAKQVESIKININTGQKISTGDHLFDSLSTTTGTISTGNISSEVISSGKIIPQTITHLQPISPSTPPKTVTPKTSVKKTSSSVKTTSTSQSSPSTTKLLNALFE